jgi:hypothetical protein
LTILSDKAEAFMELTVYLYAALFFSMTAYALYWYAMRKKLVRPNRFSWLIWGTVMAVEALTYQAVNEGMIQNLVFLMSAASCLFITLAIWRDGAWAKPSRVEMLSMAIAFAGLVLWIVFQAERWAHMLLVAAVPISFIPTWLSAREDYRREASPAWALWTLGDLATLLLIVRAGVKDPLELPYIVVELVCHASVWLLVGWRSINPRSAWDDHEVRADPRFLCGHQASDFIIERNDKGQAVLANRAFTTGTALMEFTGPRYHRSEILAHRQGVEDRFLQIDQDRYLGPSGNIDDLVNHSCSPNGGLRFEEDGRILLVALADIAKGEEISWDYSTTSSSGRFSMRCMCGSPDCRDVIGDFEFLDEALQRAYREKGLVPPYLRLAHPGSQRQARAPLAA